MDYRKTIEEMPVETYERLRTGLELGKWPDGKALTAQQREHAMQAVIAWGKLHLGAGDQVGYVDKGSKAGDVCDDPELSSLTWVDEKS
jgi:uncharacterized protein YeaC (DUF1315 family)